MLSSFSFPDMVSILKKIRVVKLHPYIHFLEFLAPLGKADRAGGSGALCSPDLHWGGGGGEDLLSQLLKCCWHQLSAASPFRDCLSYSEAVLARAEL